MEDTAGAAQASTALFHVEHWLQDAESGITARSQSGHLDHNETRWGLWSTKRRMEEESAPVLSQEAINGSKQRRIALDPSHGHQIEAPGSSLPDDIFEPQVLDIDVGKLQNSNSLSQECGFPRFRLDHGQFCLRVRNLQRNGWRATAGSDVKPALRRICNVLSGSQRLNQQSIERFISRPEQGERSQIDPSVPLRQ